MKSMIQVGLIGLALAACSGKGDDTPGETQTTVRNPLVEALGNAVSDDPCDKIIGVWRINFTDGTEEVLRVERSGDVYVLRHHKKWRLGGSGNQSLSGSCTGGILNTNSSVGNASYTGSADTIIFNGNEFARSSEEAETQRAAEAEAAAEAQRQAALVANENRRLSGPISLHAFNCKDGWAKNCAKSLQDMQNRPDLTQPIWDRWGLTPARVQDMAVNGMQEEGEVQ